MKVKVPKENKVGARVYRIRFDKDLLRDENSRGCTWWHKQLIGLAPNLNDEQKVVTFLHERLHTIDEHYCGRANLSEEITNGLAEGLYQFLKDDLGIELDFSDIDQL